MAFRGKQGKIGSFFGKFGIDPIEVEQEDRRRCVGDWFRTRVVQHPQERLAC